MLYIIIIIIIIITIIIIIIIILHQNLTYLYRRQILMYSKTVPTLNELEYF